MSDTVSLPYPFALEPAAFARPPRPTKASWSLMGDIVSARGGVPEHLIEWCRASGEDDPASQL
jgi:hypothetical protein